MGKMKDLFLGIQFSIEAQDYVQLLKELEQLPEKDKGQILLDCVSTLAQWQNQKEEKEFRLDAYLEELTDNNWHTLRELIELERNLLPIEKEEAVSNALECAIAYLTWERHYKQDGRTLQEEIERRLA